MFSRSNHHDLGQRSSSVPPLAGTRRPRSPEKTPSEVSEESTTDLQQTKSPHPQRVVKRGRTKTTDHEPAGTAQLESQFLQSKTLPPPPPLRTTHPGGPPTGLPKPTPSLADDDMKHLEQLLDSVLATAIIIQAASTTKSVLSAHARSVLMAINMLAVTDNPSKTTTSAPADNRMPGVSTTTMYAKAAMHQPSAIEPAHPDRAPPAVQKRHFTRPAKPTQAMRHSPHRLTLRWPDKPVSPTPTELFSFVTWLNTGVIGHFSNRRQDPILAANVTKSGNIVITTQAPYTAVELLSRREDILNAIEASELELGQESNPLMELDVLWYGAVVHDVPARPLAEILHTEAFGERVCNDIGVGTGKSACHTAR